MFKKLATVLIILTASVCASAQTLVNRRWVQTSGLPDSVSLAVSCLDNGNNIITGSGTVVVGQGANMLLEKRNSDGILLWTNTYNGALNGNDYLTSVATDPSGNVYALGTVHDTNVSNDIILIKYDSDGALLWEKQWNGSPYSIDIPAAMCFDGLGNIYVCGATIDDSTQSDFITIKYSDFGSFIWEARYDYAGGHDAAVGLQYSGSTGLVYVTGASANTATALDWDVATLAYDSLGNVYSSNRVTSYVGELQEPSAITKDNDGNIFVVGSINRFLTGSVDIQITKFSPTLDQMWTSYYDHDGFDEIVNSCDVDLNGDLFLTGHSRSSASDSDFLVAKFSEGGSLIWDQYITTPGNYSDGKGTNIIVDTNGNAYVSGEYRSNGNKSFMTIKLNAQGNLVWQDRLDDSLTTGSGRNIVMNSNGLLVVSGKGSNGAYGVNAVVVYDTKVIDFENVATVNGVKFLDNEIVIKVKPELVDEAFVNDRKVMFGDVYSVLDSSLAYELRDALAIGSRDALTIVKVYDWATISDSVSIARNGDTVKLDKLWSNFRLLVPSSVNTYNASYLLDTAVDGIEASSLNIIYKNLSVPNDPLYGSQSSLLNASNAINAEGAWDIETGQSFVKVGVIEAELGIPDYHHIDFGDGTLAGSRFVDGYDWANYIPLNLISQFSTHSTSVAGIIGANRNNNVGVAGIAGGSGTLADGVSLYAFCGNTSTSLGNAITKASVKTGDVPVYACDILNLSWGQAGTDPYDTDYFLYDGVRRAFLNGVTLVAARGNRYEDESSSGNTDLEFPACYKDVYMINVGGSGNDGLHKTLLNGDYTLTNGYYESKYGGKVDVIAPGSSDIIISLNDDPLSGSPLVLSSDPNFRRASGTSSAAPHVAGLAGLMLSHHAGGNYPNKLSDGDIQHLIKKYAYNVGNEDENMVGKGLIDARATLEHIDLGHGYYVLHSDQPGATMIGGATYTNDDETVTMTDYTATIPPYVDYEAKKYKCEYNFTIPIPSFSTEPYIEDKWVTHDGGVSESTTLDGEFYGEIVPSIVGSNVVGTYTFYVWNIYQTADATTSYTDLWYPANPDDIAKKFSLQMYDIKLGINTVTSNDKLLSVYPNPANTVMNYKVFHDALGTTSVCLNDILGRTVFSEVYTSTGNNEIRTLETTGLPNGLYVLTVRNGGIVSSVKVQVKH